MNHLPPLTTLRLFPRRTPAGARKSRTCAWPIIYIIKPQGRRIGQTQQRQVKQGLPYLWSHSRLRTSMPLRLQRSIERKKRNKREREEQASANQGSQSVCCSSMLFVSDKHGRTWQITLGWTQVVSQQPVSQPMSRSAPEPAGSTGAPTVASARRVFYDPARDQWQHAQHPSLGSSCIGPRQSIQIQAKRNAYCPIGRWE